MLKSLVDKIKSEPALLFGALGALATLASQVWVTHEVNAAAAVPLAIGIVTRFFVSPA